MVLATRADLNVTAVHVDHGLREGSAAESGVVEEAARRYGAEFRSVAVIVQPGGNVEARARAARRAALPPGAMTGHTADDQAETVLLNMLRGAGLDGLAGIRSGPTKPILRLRRADTRALCAVEGLSPVVDPSNDDLSFRRNRLRHELMPLAERVAARDVAEVIARQAELLGEDADLLNALAARIDPTEARALCEAPPPIARRAVRLWLANETGGPEHHPPDAAAVERVLAVARGDALACEVAGGRRVSRSAGRLRLSAE